MAALVASYERAAATVRSADDADWSFDAATQLGSLLRDLAEMAAGLRAETAARIHDEQKVPLAVLAARWAMSKARAAKLVQTGNNLRAQAGKEAGRS